MDVIILNHVHLRFTPLSPMEKLIQVWKGVRAWQIGLDGTGRKTTGPEGAGGEVRSRDIPVATESQDVL